MQKAAEVDRLDLRISPQLVDGSVYLVVEIYVDGEPLVDFDEYAIDVPGALLPSVERDGFWYIVTCTCGDPGCGGIFSGVEVRHNRGQITWHIPEPGPMRDFTFDTAQYQGEVQRLMESGRKAIKWYQPRTNFQYRFALDYNQKLFSGKLSNKEMWRWWDSATTSMLRPWSTRYEDDQED